jgi:hypothetical protein
VLKKRLANPNGVPAKAPRGESDDD